MKKIFLTTTMLLSLNALATAEYKSGDEAQPSEARLATAHACFQELANQGCGHPREDLRHFRSCLNQNLENLSASCKSFASRKYGSQASE